LVRRVLGSLVVAGAVLIAPAAAFGDVSNVSVTVTPSTKAAGAHPDVTVNESFTYSDSTDSAKTTTLHFPPGLIGNPLATPLCTQAQFQADTCPASTQVGTTTVTATVLGLLQSPADGSIYNIVPSGGAPAMLGIVVRPAGGLLGKTFLTSVVSLRTATDFGIDSVVDNMPNSTSGLATVINSVSLTLKGLVAGKPFMTNPTSCKVATTTLDVVTHAGGRGSASNSFTPTDCDKLAFKPQVTAAMGGPGGTNVTQRVPFTATISQAAGESAQSSASVMLPTGVGLSTSGATALCSAAQLAADQCPAGSRVGTGTISTPLLADAVTGPVYEIAGGNGLPGVAVKFGGTLPFTLVGKAAIVGGRVQNVFNGLPDVPLSTFTLVIDGGPHGILTASQNLCTGAQRIVTGVFGAQSGTSATVTAPVTIVGCPPTATASGRGFRGKRPRLSVVVQKALGGPALRSVSIKLPKNIKVVRSRGVSVRSAAALPKSNWRLVRSGTLSMTLPGSGAGRASVRLSAGSIRATSKLLRTLKRHRSAAMDLTVTVVDTAGRATSIPLDFDAKR
jgi:hypothetical protein